MIPMATIPPMTPRSITRRSGFSGQAVNKNKLQLMPLDNFFFDINCIFQIYGI
jgi:hypothetical protein